MTDDLMGLAEAKVDRRRADRRVSAERGNAEEDFDGDDRRAADRRNGERRRQIDPTTCERDYKPDEIEFMKAMDDYKRRSNRQFPTWSEVLEVIRDLGYRKVAAPSRTYE
ncbi:hypothetical protein KOR42_15200 [Thalassoglobus neptunius]|uniref:Uncharacterized protein n=1 Tax=Thalassoglobus neptunius TaxID=1938619 RepID=A0A5C5X675_9PLAN|nr:hypothetical protein [Thalassoglobus neptunius]TWT58149.1 hypothetical protein KOR42_15200 [Thalassoglobus neptunius]